MPDRLPPDFGPLGEGVPRAPAGALYVRSGASGVRSVPRTGEVITFGRDTGSVHVGVGTNDPGVSRQHGELRWYPGGSLGTWYLHNRGRLPIETPGGRLLPGGESVYPLPRSYVPIFIVGRDGHHLLEAVVSSGLAASGGQRRRELTEPPHRYPLNETEEKVLLGMAGRYLRFEEGCQPLSWRELVQYLDDVYDEQWGEQQLQRVVKRVRDRLHDRGVAGMTPEDFPGNPGNAVNHTLIVTLMMDGALSAERLDRMEDAGGG